jgi:putative endonuclease
MTAARLARGRFGEDIVARWYERHGFEVVSRNWRCAEGEIDIVAVRPGLVVVCEVKARASAAYGHPAEAVGRERQRRLRRAAAQWLVAHRRMSAGRTVRFDVAAVVHGRIDVIENAF